METLKKDSLLNKQLPMRLVYLIVIVIMSSYCNLLIGQNSFFIESTTSDGEMVSLFTEVVQQDIFLAQRIRIVDSRSKANYNITFRPENNSGGFEIIVTRGEDLEYVGSEQNIDTTVCCPKQGIIKSFLTRKENGICSELFGDIKDMTVINKILSSESKFNIFEMKKNEYVEIHKSSYFDGTSFSFSTFKSEVTLIGNDDYWVLQEKKLTCDIISSTSLKIDVPKYCPVIIENPLIKLCANKPYELKLKKQRKVFGVDGFRKKEVLFTVGLGLVVTGGINYLLYQKANNDISKTNLLNDSGSNIKKQQTNAILSQTLIPVGAGLVISGIFIKRK